jgi:hypothetical protein
MKNADVQMDSHNLRNLSSQQIGQIQNIITYDLSAYKWEQVHCFQSRRKLTNSVDRTQHLSQTAA